MRGTGPGLLAALVVLTGCSGNADAGGPEAQTVTVEFHLSDFDTAFSACEGTGGYSDIGSGTSVTVRTGSGDVIGAAELGKGEASSNGAQMAFCDWTVEIADVPADEDFYSVEVGSRGEVTTSRADLATDDWKVSVSLGE